MPGETKATWEWPLVDPKADKEGNRLLAAEPFSYELMGVDGQVKGGVRPFPGFQRVHVFDTSALGSNHNRTSVVTDVFPVNFLTNTGYAYGFVYRIRRESAGSTADIFIDWWGSDNEFWVIGELLKSGVALPTDLATTPNDGAQMDVAVAGKYIYVFVEGEEPVLAYHDADSATTLTVEADTGPNRRPTIWSPDESQGLGALMTMDVADRSGRGQVVLLEYLPSEVPLGLEQADDEVRTLDPGNYAFAFRLRDSTTGRLSPLSQIAEARTVDFDPLYYLGAVSGSGSGLLTGSGVGSGTETQNLFAALEILYDASKYDQALIYRSVRTQSAGGVFLGKILLLEAIIDLADYHTINNPDTPYEQAIYYYTLDDVQLVNQEVFGEDDLYDEEMPRGGAAIWYDSAMVVSKLRGTPVTSSSDENRSTDPYTRLGEVRWSTLIEWGPELFPPFNRFVPSNPASDITSMVLVGPHVLGFSPDKQFLVRKETTAIKILEIHDGYGLVGQKAVDSMGTMAVYVTTKGVKTTDANGTLDDVRVLNKVIVEDWAGSLGNISLRYDPRANVVYILNPDLAVTACLWMNTEKMTQLVDTPFRQVARGVWPTAFTLDYDDLMDAGSRGMENEGYGHAVQETVFFVLNPALNSPSSQPGVHPAVYIADYERTKTQTSGSGSGQPEYTLLPVGSDSVFEVSLVTNGGKTITVDVTGKALTTGLNGCELYVLEAADPDLVGAHGTIYHTVGSIITITDEDASVFADLVADDVVGVSPVYFQWVGWPALSVTEDGERFAGAVDLWRRKTFDSLGAYFVNVTGTESGETWARYQAAVFDGASDTAVEYADVLDGAGVVVSSVTTGEGAYEAGFGRDTNAVYGGRHGVAGNVLAPGVRIICPNLDFWLVGVVVDGNVHRIRHGTRPTIGP